MDNVDAVRDSIGKLSQELGQSPASFQRLLEKDLQLYLCRIEIKHKLPTVGIEKHFVMCRWFENKFEEDDVWVSKELHFLFCERVNCNNCVSWGVYALDDVLQKPLHGLSGHLKME